MVFFQLNEILEEEGISQNEFSRISKVRPNTINDICNNKIKRLELCTLDKILSVLNTMGYGVNDFIEYKK